MRKLVLCVLIVAVLVSCNQTKEKEIPAESVEKVSLVMTEDLQQKLTPEEALKDLLEGNKRYVSGELIQRDYPAQVKATIDGQYPKAVVLSCIDSRVPVESIFDQGIGDLFVVRVAGNIEDDDLLGSLEYATSVAGSKVLMVLGHENCGAVKAAIKKVDLSDNVTALLNEIEPAIQEVKGERDYKNKDYFAKVVKNNVHQTIEDIRKRSDIINKLENEGKIKIVGGYYSLADGVVSILGEDEHKH